MTNIHLTSPVFYAGGIEGVSSVVGYESKRNRVVRYELTAPVTGAASLTLAFSGNQMGNGQPPELDFYIGTDPESHRAAGEGSPITGHLRRSADGVTYTGSASLLLLPGERRYVWVFPSDTVFGWMAWSRENGCAVATCSGGALTVCTSGAVTLGQTLELQLTRYGDFTHTVTARVGDVSLVLCEDSRAERLLWQPPLSLVAQIPGATGQAALRITTFSHGEPLGSTTAAVTLSVPADQVPTVTATWNDPLGPIPGVLLQELCRFDVTVEAVPAPGSTIVSTEVTLDGGRCEGVIPTKSGNHLLQVRVTDSRGRSATWEETVFVTPYRRPQCTLEAYRCDGAGTPDEMGEFALATVRGYVWPLEQTVATPWVTVYLEGETGETVFLEPGEVDYQWLLPVSSLTSHSLKAALYDGAAMGCRAETVIPIGYATLDLLSGGHGIAFGTTAREEGFTCAMPARFEGGLRVDGSALTDFVVERGVSGGWCYEKYKSGIAKLWCVRDAAFRDAYTMSWSSNYPFALTTVYNAQATCNYAAGGGNSWSYGWNTKLEYNTTGCQAFVQSTSQSFGKDNAFRVSAAIVGLWK